jgi:hypothetical protein
MVLNSQRNIDCTLNEKYTYKNTTEVNQIFDSQILNISLKKRFIPIILIELQILWVLCKHKRTLS